VKVAVDCKASCREQRVRGCTGALIFLTWRSTGGASGFPNLGAYLARGEARPAYQRAFDAQLALYTGRN
jgi:hypothetical protein